MTNHTEREIDVSWQGPFAWPKYEEITGLPPIPKLPGIYLQAFDYNDGFLIYTAGITRRTIPKRFSEHTKKYRNGDYTVLDLHAIKDGKRKEIWHGWGWTPEKKQDFKRRNEEILAGVDNQLAGFRIFVADIGIAPRILERLEAAVMNNLYKQPVPFCDIPDRGMQLAPRWDSELALVARFESPIILHGLPAELTI